MFDNMLKTLTHVKPKIGGEYVHVNDGFTPGGLYYEVEQFTKAYIAYMSNKDSNGKTDTNNNMQLIGALNYVFIDGDWTFDTSGMQDINDNVIIDGEIPREWCNLIANDVLEEFMCIFEDTNIEFSFSVFTPEVCNVEPNVLKGGFHIFFSCSRNVTVDERESFYGRFRQSYIHTFDSYSIWNRPDDVNVAFEKIFDKGPLFNCLGLLPYARKVGAKRNYIRQPYPDKYSYGFNVNVPFVIPTVYTGSSKPNQPAITPKIGTDGIDSIIETLSDVEVTITNKDYGWLGSAGKMIKAFMESLVYLCRGHLFWKTLADNEQRLNTVMKPLLQMLFMCHFINNNGQINATHESVIPTLATKILKPLLDRTVKDNEQTRRNTFNSCLEHATQYYRKYCGIMEISTEVYRTAWWVYTTSTRSERLAFLSGGTDPSKGVENARNIEKLVTSFSVFFSNWVLFIKMIMSGLTDEIEPFLKVRGLEDPRERMSFTKLDTRSADNDFYRSVLKQWISMFIVVQFYETENKINEAARRVISAFTRNYIWTVNTGTGDHEMYIYNIHQYGDLWPYPYNQWLFDKDGTLLKEWFKYMYSSYIDPCLEKTSKLVYMKPLTDIMKKAEIVTFPRYLESIALINNYEKELEQLFRNVVGAFKQETTGGPRPIDVMKDPYFPMRNGILQFKSNGDVLFHENNRSRYMNAYTNVIWDPQYMEHIADNEAWQRVDKMWKEIYPIEAEREYVLTFYSTVLTGNIMKDMMMQQYGTGGDGKTIANAAIQNMLGCDGIISNRLYCEDGRMVTMINPNGLATTMKSETILVSNNHGHDSGGTINLKNKRFCSMQEPDPSMSNGTLNCARIKEILSGGGGIQARRIYGDGETIIINALLTLQTNVMMSYSEDNEAVRRRMVVVQHRSKFVTMISNTGFENLEYTYNADPSLMVALSNDPDIWQAVFYSLLGYCQKFIRSNAGMSLSYITMPDEFVASTVDSFMSSNGIVGWFLRRIRQSNGDAIRVSDIINNILQDNSADRAEHGSLLTSGSRSSRRERHNEITNQIMGTYIGHIYIVRGEFKVRGRVPDNFVVRHAETNGELIDSYFQKYALTNMNCGVSSHEDKYLVGYTFI